MSKIKIVFAGTSEYANAHLKELIASKHSIEAVFTQPSRRSGRGLKFKHSPVRETAYKNNIEIWQPEKISKKEIDILYDINPDLVVVVSYGLILPEEFLNIPKHGCINVHPSLLPRWRGAAPIQRSIEYGDNLSGITIMQMNGRLDEGDIIYQEPIEIDKNKTAGEIEEKFISIGKHVMSVTIDSIIENNFMLFPQDHKLSTYAKKISKNEAKINWEDTAKSIHNKIMAFNPWPIAEASLDGQRIRIFKSEYDKISISGIPGTIKSFKDNIKVFTKEGILIIKELQKENSKIINAKDFINSNNLMGKKFK